MRLLLQRLGGGCRLFHQGRVLLRGLVHVGDGGAHFGNASALLLAGAADLGHDGVHLADAVHHLGHGGPGLLHLAAAAGHLRDGVFNQPFDLFGGLGAAPGQGAHFAGDDGKTPALFARPGGFDGSVQRQDIGLKGDTVNHADDGLNLARCGLNAAHGLHHLADDLPAVGRNV